MSTIKITIRCDHEVCTRCAEVTDPKSLVGWSRVQTQLFDRVGIAHDYCPAHAVLHHVEVKP